MSPALGPSGPHRVPLEPSQSCKKGSSTCALWRGEPVAGSARMALLKRFSSAFRSAHRGLGTVGCSGCSGPRSTPRRYLRRLDHVDVGVGAVTRYAPTRALCLRLSRSRNGELVFDARPSCQYGSEPDVVIELGTNDVSVGNPNWQADSGLRSSSLVLSSASSS
jgi:hypothetical protein